MTSASGHTKDCLASKSLWMSQIGARFSLLTPSFPNLDRQPDSSRLSQASKSMDRGAALRASFVLVRGQPGANDHAPAWIVLRDEAKFVRRRTPRGKG